MQKSSIREVDSLGSKKIKVKMRYGGGWSGVIAFWGLFRGHTDTFSILWLSLFSKSILGEIWKTNKMDIVTNPDRIFGLNHIWCPGICSYRLVVFLALQYDQQFSCSHVPSFCQVSRPCCEFQPAWLLKRCCTLSSCWSWLLSIKWERIAVGLLWINSLFHGLYARRRRWPWLQALHALHGIQGLHEARVQIEIHTGARSPACPHQVPFWLIKSCTVCTLYKRHAPCAQTTCTHNEAEWRGCNHNVCVLGGCVHDGCVHEGCSRELCSGSFVVQIKNISEWVPFVILESCAQRFKGSNYSPKPPLGTLSLRIILSPWPQSPLSSKKKTMKFREKIIKVRNI